MTAIKNIAIAILLCCITLSLEAQLYNDGCQITVQSNAVLHVQGDFIHQAGVIDNAGIVEIGNDWINNGSNNPIIDTQGTVVLFGTNQNIGGTAPSSFYNLVFDGLGDISLLQNAGVNGFLDIGQTNLLLNQNQISLINPANTALVSNGGQIVSETAISNGTLVWNIGSSTGTYLLPFGSGVEAFPLQYSVAQAGAGNGAVSFATYPTSAINMPLPAGVSNLNLNGADDALNMVDRFWIIDGMGFSADPMANITFAFDQASVLAPNTLDPTQLQVAEWDAANMNWTEHPSTSFGNQVAGMGPLDSGIFTLRSEGGAGGTNCTDIDASATPFCFDTNSYTVTLEFAGPFDAGGYQITRPDGSNVIINGQNGYTDSNTYNVAQFPTYSYTITALMDPTCSVQIGPVIAECSGPTPIELVDFDGQEEGKANALRWTTGSESNNNTFTLWRSDDALDFVKVADLASQGEATSAQHYNYLDFDFRTNLSYYRLSQTDLDGTQTFVGSVIAIQRSSAQFEILNTYPNPSSDILQVAFESTQEKEVLVTMVDISGKVIERRTHNPLNGKNVVKFDVRALSKGVYYITISNQERTLGTVFMKN